MAQENVDHVGSNGVTEGSKSPRTEVHLKPLLPHLERLLINLTVQLFEEALPSLPCRSSRRSLFG